MPGECRGGVAWRGAGRRSFPGAAPDRVEPAAPVTAAGRHHLNRVSEGTARDAGGRGAARPAAPLPVSPRPGRAGYRCFCTTPACMKTCLVEQAPIG